MDTKTYVWRKREGRRYRSVGASSGCFGNYVWPPRTTKNNKHWTNRSSKRSSDVRYPTWRTFVIRPPLFVLRQTPTLLLPRHRLRTQSIKPARLSTHMLDCSANMPKFIVRATMPSTTIANSHVLPYSSRLFCTLELLRPRPLPLSSIRDCLLQFPRSSTQRYV